MKPSKASDHDTIPALKANRLHALHTIIIGRHVYLNQLLEGVAGNIDLESAFTYLTETLRKMNPRDPLKEMLVVQAIWTQARLARLSMVANQQTNINSVKVLTTPATGHPAHSGGRCSPWRSTDALPARTRSGRSNRPTLRNNRWCRMPQTKIQSPETLQTKQDCRLRTPRTYRLSPAGLQSLQFAIRQYQPWRKTTGPRTAEGKARSKMNAMKRGERTADSIAARRAQWALLLLLQTQRREKAAQPEIFCDWLLTVWIDRVAGELAGVVNI